MIYEEHLAFCLRQMEFIAVTHVIKVYTECILNIVGRHNLFVWICCVINDYICQEFYPSCIEFRVGSPRSGTPLIAASHSSMVRHPSSPAMLSKSSFVGKGMSKFGKYSPYLSTQSSTSSQVCPSFLKS